jgi:hypothetical protein
MYGIDFVQTKPIQCQAAVWDPTDEVQRATVLAWLDGLGFNFAVHPAGPLVVGNSQVAYPGDHLVVDLEFGPTIAVFTCEEYQNRFDFVSSAYDPHQSFLAGFEDLLDFLLAPLS